MLNPEDVYRGRRPGLKKPSPLSLLDNGSADDMTSTPMSSPYTTGLRFADSPNFEKMMEDVLDLHSASAANGRDCDSPTLQSLPTDMVLALKQLWESRSDQENHLTDRLDRTTIAWEEKQVEWEQKEAEHSDLLEQAQATILQLERDKREMIDDQAQRKRMMTEQLETTLAGSEGEMAHYRKEIQSLTAQLKLQRSEQEVLEDKVVGLEDLTDALETRALNAEAAKEATTVQEVTQHWRATSPDEGTTTIGTDDLDAMKEQITTLELDCARLNECLELEREQHLHSLDAMTVALRSSQARAEAADDAEEHMRSRLAELATEIAGLETQQPGEEACLTCQLQSAETRQVAETILEQMEAQSKIVEDELADSAAKDVKIAGLTNEVRWLREEIKEQSKEYETLITCAQTSAAKLTGTYEDEANSLRTQLVKVLELLKGKGQVCVGDIAGAFSGQETVQALPALPAAGATPFFNDSNEVFEV